MNKELRVLVVEDSPQDMALINHELRKAGFHFRSRRVESREAFLHELEHHPPDVILSDHNLPGFDGFAAIAEARNFCPNAPFIFVTGASREEAARGTLQTGADDYVLKDHLNLLGPAIERALGETKARANQLRLESALLDAEEQLYMLVKELKEHTTFLLDDRGCIASWNPGAGQILGHEPNDILGGEFAKLFAPKAREQDLPAAFVTLAADKGRAELSTFFSRKNGDTFPVEITLICLRGEANRTRGFLCVLHDCGQRHSPGHPSENRVAQLEAATREMEKFTHAIGREIQVPLRHLESCSELLVKTALDQLDPKSQGHLKAISESARRMDRLVDDLLTFSRIGQTEMYRLNLSLKEITREVIHDLRHETDGRSVEWVLGELPEVSGDSVMLWQVMTNLISNALKFTRTRPRARIEIGSSDGENEHVIFVRDNGVGFAPRYAEQLFSVFQRLHKTDFEGTGIGLANVRRIIERHGGRVWAEGEEDGGAAFYFSIPK